MKTPTLNEFLLARFDEDEAIARDVMSGEWNIDNAKAQREGGAHFIDVDASNGGWVARTDAIEDARHIARHSPDRVLFEVEAKRGLIASAREAIRREAASHGLTPRDDSHLDEWCEGPILQFLALPYADHPDYRQEWRP